MNVTTKTVACTSEYNNTITIQSAHSDTSFCVRHIIPTDIRLPKIVTNPNHNSRPTFLVVSFWAVHHILAQSCCHPEGTVLLEFSPWPRSAQGCRAVIRYCDCEREGCMATSFLGQVQYWTPRLVLWFSSSTHLCSIGRLGAECCCPNFLHGLGQALRYVTRPNLVRVPCILKFIFGLFCDILSICPAGSILGSVPLPWYSLYLRRSFSLFVFLFCESSIILFSYAVLVCIVCMTVTWMWKACGPAVSPLFTLFIASEVHEYAACISRQDWVVL